MSIDQRLKEIRREPSTDAAGDPERLRRIALTKQEMMAQGEAIRATLEGNKESLAAIGSDLVNRNIRRIITVGCGDSWIAGHGVRPAVEEALDAPCEPVEAFDLANYGLNTIDDQTLVVGLSSSGETEPVIKSLTVSAAKGAYTVGLSNTLGSTLMKQCPGALHIVATRGGWPTQSSTAAMALMIAMAASVQKAKGGDVAVLEAALYDLPQQAETVAQSFYEPARAVAQHLAKVNMVLTTGAGPYFAPAEFGAAKLRELAPIHAYSFPLEEYHHYRTQKAGDVMLMVAADEASHTRALETAIMSRGSKGYCLALLPEGETEISAFVDVAWHLPSVVEATAPIIYSIPMHLFGYHLAVERDALGLGAPRMGLEHVT